MAVTEKKTTKELGVIIVARRYSEPDPRPEGRIRRALGGPRGLSEEEKKTVAFAKKLKEVMDEIGP